MHIGLSIVSGTSAGESDVIGHRDHRLLEMKIIDEKLLNEVSLQAKESPRLRMNFNFHQSLDAKCHRFLNAVEPGTVVPIHRHPTKDESFVILRGKVRVTTHNDDGSIIEDVVLSQESGCYGVDIPKGVWHMVEALVLGSVVFECKAGAVCGA